MCRPHCLAAIELYNAQASYKIVPDTINIGFNLEKQTLSLDVQLRTDAGYEPDESYSFEEEEQMMKKLARFLNPKLKTAGIELTLSAVSVPPDYFPK